MTPMQEEPLTIQTLRQSLKKSADVQCQEYMFQENKVYFFICEEMVDTYLLNELVVERIGKWYDSNQGNAMPQDLKKLPLPGMKKIETLNDATFSIYTGCVVLYFEHQQLFLSANIAKKPNRQPEETRMEVLVKGPRDNFIEDISVNIALIRKRLPTNSLCVEKLEVGRRSKTTVAILYFDDIADLTILQGIKEKIQKLDMDIMVSGDLLMECINKSDVVFPRDDYTGRPDTAVQMLARGRFVILADGVAYAVITPINLFLLLKSGEDNEYPAFFSSLERLLRVVGILIGLLLPAFWLALTTFHQNQLPLQLLATIVQANMGLPFPTALEMLVMLLMFELFREASLSLPTVIGGTISVVGGLIIGDAAIRAGITSPAMIVVIAISTVATYALNNQALLTAVNITRLFFILLTSFFGLFGFYISLYVVLIYLCSIRIFGVPYMNLAGNLSWATIARALLRLPQPKYTTRPDMLNPQDATRIKEVRDE